MAQPHDAQLSRRERQIMDTVYRLGEGSAAAVQRALADEVGYDTVRVTLGILEKKGFVRHRQEGQRYIYTPTIPHEAATRSALTHVVQTFFRGSATKAILALLDGPSGDLTDEQLAEIQAWIDRAREEQ